MAKYSRLRLKLAQATFFPCVFSMPSFSLSINVQGFPDYQEMIEKLLASSSMHIFISSVVGSRFKIERNKTLIFPLVR